MLNAITLRSVDTESPPSLRMRHLLAPPLGSFGSVRVGETPPVFDELSRTDVNLAIWRRGLPDGLEASLQRWAKLRKDGHEQVISPSNFELAPLLRQLGGPAREWLSKDLTILIGRFRRISGAKRIRITFGPIHSDRCRKFHTDNLRYRLICTYLGPGTEWVPNEAVDRAAMDGVPGCPLEANTRIVRCSTLIQHASVGDVLMMKQDLHPDGLGLVHRSPPIEQLGGTRVALILSTVDGEW